MGSSKSPAFYCADPVISGPGDSRAKKASFSRR
jgi:hypothetical protein